MILHMGTRTTEPLEVAFRTLDPGEEEATAIHSLLPTLTADNPYEYNRFNHSMVVFYDPPGTPDRHRELMIPVQRPIDGVKIKTLPSFKAAFLVFKGMDTPIEEYYELLLEYIRESDLKVSTEIYSIEVMYIPEDLDEQDYTLEIMIPLAS